MVTHDLDTLLPALGGLTLPDAAASLVGAGASIIAVAPTRKGPLQSSAHINECDVCKAAGIQGASRKGQISTDLDSVRKWWGLHPDANIGVPGLANGLLWLDIDADAGWEWWSRHARREGFETMTALTPGDGERHRVVMRVPADRATEALPGGGSAIVDSHGVKVDGITAYCRVGYVLVPPSIHERSLRPYGDFSSVPIATAPPWLLDRIVTTATSSSRTLTTTETESIVAALSHPGISDDPRAMCRMVAAHRELHTATERHPALRAALARAVAYAAEGRLRLKPWLEVLAAEWRDRTAADTDRDIDGEFVAVLVWLLGAQFEVDSPKDLYAITLAADVAKEVHRMTVRKLASDEFADSDLSPSPPMRRLSEIIAEGLPPLRWRVAGLLPEQGRAVIVAQRKTGKTTVVLNLAKQLLAGGKFLGLYDVEPLAADQSVVVLNYEVAESQIAAWCVDHGIDPERLVLWTGRGSTSPFVSPAKRQELVERLTAVRCAVLVIDPFANAFGAGGGGDQNDNSAVASFLANVNQVAEAAGVGEVVIAVHAGWGDSARARGASALEDFPDSIWTLESEDGEDGDERSVYFAAKGRDVEVEKMLVEYHAATRDLTASGVSPKNNRRNKKATRDVDKVVAFIRAHSALHNGDGASTVAVKKGAGLGHTATVTALDNAVDAGLLTRSSGPHNAQIFSLSRQDTETSQIPSYARPVLSPPLRGGDVETGQIGSPVPEDSKSRQDIRQDDGDRTNVGGLGDFR